MKRINKVVLNNLTIFGKILTEMTLLQGKLRLFSFEPLNNKGSIILLYTNGNDTTFKSFVHSDSWNEFFDEFERRNTTSLDCDYYKALQTFYVLSMTYKLLTV